MTKLKKKHGKSVAGTSLFLAGVTTASVLSGTVLPAQSVWAKPAAVQTAKKGNTQPAAAQKAPTAQNATGQNTASVQKAQAVGQAKTATTATQQAQTQQKTIPLTPAAYAQAAPAIQAAQDSAVRTKASAVVANHDASAADAAVQTAGAAVSVDSSADVQAAKTQLQNAENTLEAAKKATGTYQTSQQNTANQLKTYQDKLDTLAHTMGAPKQPEASAPTEPTYTAKAVQYQTDASDYLQKAQQILEANKEKITDYEAAQTALSTATTSQAEVTAAATALNTAIQDFTDTYNAGSDTTAALQTVNTKKEAYDAAVQTFEADATAYQEKGTAYGAEAPLDLSDFKRKVASSDADLKNLEQNIQENVAKAAAQQTENAAAREQIDGAYQAAKAAYDTFLDKVDQANKTGDTWAKKSADYNQQGSTILTKIVLTGQSTDQQVMDAYNTLGATLTNTGDHSQPEEAARAALAEVKTAFAAYQQKTNAYQTVLDQYASKLGGNATATTADFSAFAAQLDTVQQTFADCAQQSATAIHQNQQILVALKEVVTARNELNKRVDSLNKKAEIYQADKDKLAAANPMASDSGWMRVDQTEEYDKLTDGASNISDLGIDQASYVTQVTNQSSSPHSQTVSYVIMPGFNQNAPYQYYGYKMTIMNPPHESFLGKRLPS